MITLVVRRLLQGLLQLDLLLRCSGSASSAVVGDTVFGTGVTGVQGAPSAIVVCGCGRVECGMTRLFSDFM